MFDDSGSWPNVFFRDVTSQIDEELFSVLYDSELGRPNASIRQLVAMLILKEGRAWSDEQLYENCRFNLQVMWALGLRNFDDEVPSESTYYDFKASLVRQMEEACEDLLGQAFEKLTASQANKFEVNGQEIRMDAKLINSNIAMCTRLQLVISVMTKFYKSLSQADQELLNSQDQTCLQELIGQSAWQHTYGLSTEQKDELLKELGAVLVRLKDTFCEEHSPHYALIERLWEEQYRVGSPDQEEEVEPRDNDDIGADTLQSAHDAQATYRRKQSGRKRQHIRGFSSNITETCAKGDLHLITDVQTAKASKSDDQFFQTAVNNTRQVSGPINALWSDGSYHSQDNVTFHQEQEQPFEWHISAMQGKEGYYDFEWTEQGELLVTDRRNGLTQTAHRTPKYFRIDEHFAKDKYRYFEPKTIENYFRRQRIKAMPEAIRKRRANVEATIHQIFHTLDGSKSKYRGLIRNHLFVLCRCFWVNFKRMEAQIAPKLALLTSWSTLNRKMNQISAYLTFLAAFFVTCRVEANTKFYSVISKN